MTTTLMIYTKETTKQILEVNSFQNLIQTPFQGTVNALCWNRTLKGNFAEIVQKLESHENINIIELEQLIQLELSEDASLARDIIINDMKMLEEEGALPQLNLIKQYERDEEYSFFPTDVYSYHVDRAPVPAHTILCTYFGTTSEILPNAQAIQKILIPEIRAEIEENYKEEEHQDFDDFLTENFLDLHYEPKPNAQPISLGLGHMVKLAIDHPDSTVLPCIHRAPLEKNREFRLLLIC